ncbi:MAG: hypothetical protein IPF54_06730 [Draconibacterium sp.]|nr:hypothetical protein [Draconibacterium sp.]
MNIIYKRIMNLVVGHNYFKDGLDRFVTLYPNAATEALLRNGKMLFKRLPNGITILYKTLDDETTPFVELDKNQHFVFVIKSANIPGLLNITDFDESPMRQFGSGKIIYFTNDPANPSHNSNSPEILTNEILDSVKGPLFTYQFSINGNPATVKIIVTDAAGNPVSVGKDGNGVALPTTISLSINSNNTFEQQIDLRDYQRGRYQIEIKNDAETLTLKSEEIYVDELLEKDNILGVVDILYNAATDNLYGETEEYKIQLKSADSFWKFYIINKSKNIDFSTDSLLITDSGVLNGVPYIINDFRRLYASIGLTAKLPGAAGNLITLSYSGGTFTAISLSGKTLSGGGTGLSSTGTITIVNNDITGYTVNIGGINFAEGTEFNRGTTPADTATNLIAAINGNGAVQVTASILEYDILVNNLKTLVFGSIQKIPFYESPKLKIGLMKVSDNQTIIANLPNPSHSGIKKSFADRIESEVYVFI